ncbi:sensor histidine kinase [Streptomyces longwoodensis]|uniref:sensor histidine kinase n=1 Tax=Streptomyces longwoodensis TaxID=68231 RepID=UPI0033A61228
MTSSELRPTTSPPAEEYRHELYPYRDREEFLEGTLGFIREALEGGEAVIVAVPGHKASLLRSELSADGAVHYVDTTKVARHPGRLIGAWREWINEHAAQGRPVRGIGESAWEDARSQAEREELRHHEWLLNKAFAAGPAWWLLCPYDTSGERPTLAQMSRCHPAIRTAGRSEPSTTYDPRAPFDFTPLTPSCDPHEEFTYTSADLSVLREKIAACAAELGLGGRRLRELSLAATEVASNSVRHGGGQGVLRTWNEDRRLVCEFRDAGHIEDPLVGRSRPERTQIGGRGLWLVHQLCDLVEMRSTPDEGTTIRLHMDLPA